MSSKQKRDSMYVGNIVTSFGHDRDCKNPNNEVRFTQYSDKSGYGVDCANCGTPLISFNSITGDITTQQDYQ